MGLWEDFGFDDPARQAPAVPAKPEKGRTEGISSTTKTISRTVEAPKKHLSFQGVMNFKDFWGGLLPLDLFSTVLELSADGRIVCHTAAAVRERAQAYCDKNHDILAPFLSAMPERRWDNNTHKKADVRQALRRLAASA